MIRSTKKAQRVRPSGALSAFGVCSVSLFAGFAMLCSLASAATYILPAASDAVVGEVRTVIARHEDTLLDLGRSYGVGYEEIVAANHGVDPWIPGEGRIVIIPSLYVLPDVPREGIVVSLAEHRLYYYPQRKPGEVPVVITYPISTGKMDWKTPLGISHIVDKRVRPTWYPPESVRREHAAEGRPLPRAVPPGPDNPLGEYAMRLDIPGGAYLIHGTNQPIAVGMQVTHGCIRMFPEDIADLFKQVPINTPVRIVDQPYKMGWRGGELFIEVHAPTEGQDRSQTHSLTDITRLLVSATQSRPVAIDWAKAEMTFARSTGIPQPVMLHDAAPASTQVVDSVL